MSVRRRLASGLLTLFAVALVAVVLLLIWKQPGTPPIRGADGAVVPESVSLLQQVELGGVEQWVLIRGHGPEKPVLLFLHGGPGMPMMYLAHAFQRPLEEEFLVVQWDRRGAGKSYSQTRPPDDMRISQLLSDTHQLIDVLKRRYKQEKIFLAGHSFGSYLGMLYAARYPEDLHAFIGIGQVVDREAARTIQEAFIRRKARELGRPEAIAELDSGGDAAFEAWLFEFGAELHGATSWWPLLWTGFLAPEYGLTDVMNVPKGSSFSSQHMQYDDLQTSLLDGVREVDVPVYFFTGRHDVTTPYELAEAYHQVIQAPDKGLVWFENSAHFPFFEEPDLFAAQMVVVRNSVIQENRR